MSRSLSRIVRIVAAFAVVVALVAFARNAGATPNFPGAIAGALGGAAPKCSICHVCNQTMRGTVNTPWGSAMRGRGLQAYDEGSLAAALAKMEADKVDSNGDGTIDVDAVRMGKDPNPPTCGDDVDPTIPQYGCLGRIAPKEHGGTSSSVLPFALLVVVAGAIARRRRGQLLGGVLVLTLAGASALACQSGAARAPRDELFAVKPKPSPPRMAPIVKTALEADLQALGLDPRNLPAFNALEPRQLRGVMSTFTRSLGFSCTDCHDANDHRVPTRRKTIAVHMWNEMVRRFAIEGGQLLYCDSCHQGQGKFLDRQDKGAVAGWMSENFTDKLKTTGAGVGAKATKDSGVECATCHGDPFDASILAKWVR